MYVYIFEPRLLMCPLPRPVIVTEHTMCVYVYTQLRCKCIAKHKQGPGLFLWYAKLATLWSTTVEPPNKGHFGNGHCVFFSKAVPISEACHCLTI